METQGLASRLGLAASLVAMVGLGLTVPASAEIAAGSATPYAHGGVVILAGDKNKRNEGGGRHGPNNGPQQGKGPKEQAFVGGNKHGKGNKTVVNKTVVNKTVINKKVVIVRPVRHWYHRPYYGTLVGGVALGAFIAATAAGVVPVAPASNLCWYWTDPSMTQGYWDYCY